MQINLNQNSSVIRFSQDEEIITQIPGVVAKLILSLLKGDDVARMGLTCRTFRMLINDQNLWKILFEKDFPFRNLHGEALPKEQYSLIYRIEMNWRKMRFSSKTLMTNMEWGSGILLDGSTIISVGDNEKSIQFWDIRTGKLIKSLPGNPGGDFESFLIDGELLLARYSYGAGGDVKVFNKHNGTRLCHIDSGWNFLIDGERFIFSRYVWENHGCSLEFHNKYDGSLLMQLPENDHIHVPLLIDGERLITANTKGVIKFWDKNTGLFLHSIGWEKEDEVTNLIVHQDFLIAGYVTGKIRVWNKNNFSLLKTLHDFQLDDEFHTHYVEGEGWKNKKGIGTLLVDSDRLIATYSIEKTSEKFINIWDLNHETLLKTLPGQSPRLMGELVCYLGKEGSIQVVSKDDGSLRLSIDTQVTSGFLVDGVRVFALVDNKLNIWDVNTGALIQEFSDEVDSFLVNDDRIIIEHKKKGIIQIYDFNFSKPDSSITPGFLQIAKKIFQTIWQQNFFE